MSPYFHYLARAIIRDGEYVLLAHSQDADNKFLPGGHIEPGEGARCALSRELREELDVEARIGQFAGAVEHAWEDADLTRHFEINLVFEVQTDGLSPAAQVQAVPAAEQGLAFHWVRVADLHKNNLQPSPLIAWLQTSEQRVRWGSTIE